MFAVPNAVNRLQIEVTTGCNLGCAGCQRTIGMEAGKWRNSHMKLDLYSKVIANAPPANALILQGIGEPTLHPQLPEMISRGRASGKFKLISFNTNALVRDLAFYAEMVRLGLSHVSVSVDSLDPVTAEAVRAGTDVVKLAEMVRDLGRMFGGMTISIVLSRKNLPELADLLSRLHGLGARFVEIQPLISYAKTSDAVCLTDGDIVQARHIIEGAPTRWPGMAVMPAGALTPNGTRCRRPMRAVYITVEGYLTPCCTTNDVKLFGRTSLAEMDFATAWTSPGVANWLNGFFDRDAAICHGCAFNPSGAKAPPPPLAQGVAAHQQGKLEEAEQVFRAIAGTADTSESLHRLGLIELARGRTERAVELIDSASHLTPDVRYDHNAAVALGRAGRIDEAVERLAACVKARPDYRQSYFSLANIAREHGRPQLAADALGLVMERANDVHEKDTVRAAAEGLSSVAATPRNLIMLANRLRVAGNDDLARQLLDRRIAAEPQDVAARLTRAMAALTVVHSDEEEIRRRRAACSSDLVAIADAMAGLDTERLRACAGVVGMAKPFFLSYHGENDRPLMEIYGAILDGLTEAAGRRDVPTPARRDKLRVGFVSYYFTLHSVSKLFAGWMKHLDRSRFEVIGYNLSAGEDAMSRSISETCDAWHGGQKSTQEWLEIIGGDAPDILVYLELGMNGTAVELACHRLAPVQCMAWGHPVTSGLKHIDYFLSSDLMEPEDGASHYREQLIRLPGLSIAYDALPVSAGRLTRAAAKLRDNATVYICCQSLFKYLPRHDHVFVDIARAVPDSQFLFIGSGEARPTQIFTARLEAAFRAAGLDPARHIVIAAPVPFDMFGSLIGLGNVYLDSIGWSGGNTTLEALTLGLPVVTVPTALMRGRHSAAILTQMGLADTIAADVDDYIARAVRLADPRQEADLRAHVAETRHKLFGDMRPVRALEQFFVAARAGAAMRTPPSVAAEAAGLAAAG